MLTQLLHSTLSSLSSLSLISPTHTYFPAHRPRAPPRPLLPPIRMGGGPRTFPGGVSKWQWKRMQAKKAKQLLKARLLRERQIYEMRKRAELKAAVSELEKPWELVEKAPTLLSVTADEQVKALADRFQKPGGFDMWSDRDGPQVFRRKDDGSILPSRRFFPKGVVHSVRPYGLVGDGESEENGENEVGFDDWIARGGGGVSRRRRKDCRQDVRPNADEKRDIDSDCIDVEARWVGDKNGRESRKAHLPLENLKGLKKVQGVRGNSYGLDLQEHGKNLSRSGQRGSGRQVRGEKITLRPTADLNYVKGSNLVKDSKWRDGNGFSSNRERSL